jgi:hypothetical protein
MAAVLPLLLEGGIIRSPTGAGVPEIIKAVQELTTWKLPSQQLAPAPPASLWTTEAGEWNAPVIHSPHCAQRVPGLHSSPSIRAQVRFVHRDTGSCRAVGNVDAGTCIQSNGTAPIWCFPSLIIMGTGKGGTAELQSWLGRHPNLKRIGDPNSTVGGGEADYFGRELRTEAQLEATWRQYLQVWRPQNVSRLTFEYAFEKSPGYLAHSTYPKLLQLLMPSVKLIAILRDPTKRVYSHFQMVCTREKSKMNKYRVTKAVPQGRARHIDVSGVFRENVRHGKAMPFCTADDFDNFIRQRGPASGKLDGLFKTGLYAADLKRWYTIFPRDQIMVLFNEHFVKDAIQMFDQIQSFLGVPHFNYNELVYTSEAGYTLLRGSTSKAEHKLRKTYAPMSNWAKTTLDEYYNPHTAELFDLLLPDNPGLEYAKQTWGK